jgi:hypothetical protein
MREPGVVKFFRVSDADGLLHAVTEMDRQPLCHQAVALMIPDDLSGAFSSTHPSACPQCVAAVAEIRGDPDESYVDDYTGEVTEPPGEVAAAEPDDDSPTGTAADTPAGT